jgi:hypothetical protein
MRIANTIKRVQRYRAMYGTRELVREIGVRTMRKIHTQLPNRVRAALRPRVISTLVRVLGPGYTVIAPPPPPVPAVPGQTGVNARELVKGRSPDCTALQIFPVPRSETGRVNLVTDNINRGSLYGGVGTSIIMAALVAEARGARLRIVTRHEAADPSGLQTLLDCYGIGLSHDIQFAWAPLGSGSSEIDVADDEVFITTSWWTTAATLASVRTEAVIYLLQEDERMFYPHGDDHLLCSRVMQNKDIRFVINTRLLYDHLVASGLPNVKANGIWFEPSFPPELFYPREREEDARPRLLFYARPLVHARNLFYFGLEVLEAAITRGIIDLQEWDVVLVGRDIPDLRLDDGEYIPERVQNLDWAQYADLAGKTDLALCLMYTPHPSYPPFDLAASGAVVITNRYGNKQDLSAYSANIICSDLDMDAMLESMARGVQLALDPRRRGENFADQRLGQDWKQSFAHVLNHMNGAA